MLRLLSRRRCLSCEAELPVRRDYPMQVCVECILHPEQRNAFVGVKRREDEPSVEPFPAA